MRRSVLSAIVVASWLATAGLGATAVAQTTPKYPGPNFTQVGAGETQSGQAILPTKVNADADGVTGHLVIDCATGCAGGGGAAAGTTTTLPSPAPTNAPGTTNVPQYSTPSGSLITHDDHTTASPLPVVQQGAIAANPSGILTCGISTASATGCSAPASLLIGIQNNSTVAQTATVTCTWSGGGIVFPPLGLGQIVFEPQGGLPISGTTPSCIASAAPTATGTPSGASPVLVFFR